MTSERCAAFRDDLAAYRAGALDAARAADHDAHLDRCPDCGPALAADRDLDAWLTEAGSLEAAANESTGATARLLARVDTTPAAAPASASLPWGWILGVGFALLATLTADWGRPDPAPARPRDPWRYHAPPELDRDELPLDTTDQPLPGELTWRVP